MKRAVTKKRRGNGTKRARRKLVVLKVMTPQMFEVHEAIKMTRDRLAYLEAELAKLEAARSAS